MTNQAKKCCPSCGHELEISARQLEWVERSIQNRYFLGLDEHMHGFCIEKYSLHDPELPFYAYLYDDEIGHFGTVDEAKARCQAHADRLAKRMCVITKEGGNDVSKL